MLFDNSANEVAGPPPKPIPEFYNVRLATLDDGGLSLSIVATMFDPDELELLERELVSQRVDTMDDALDLIKAGVHFA